MRRGRRCQAWPGGPRGRRARATGILFLVVACVAAVAHGASPDGNRIALVGAYGGSECGGRRGTAFAVGVEATRALGASVELDAGVRYAGASGDAVTTVTKESTGEVLYDGAGVARLHWIEVPVLIGVRGGLGGSWAAKVGVGLEAHLFPGAMFETPDEAGGQDYEIPSLADYGLGAVFRAQVTRGRWGLFTELHSMLTDTQSHDGPDGRSPLVSIGLDGLDRALVGVAWSF